MRTYVLNRTDRTYMKPPTENDAALIATPQKAPVLAGDRGLHFNDMESMWRFCVAVSNSKAFKDVDTPENALVRIQAGLELGLSPIWSLCNVMFFSGRPAVWGDALLGLVQGHKDCVDVTESIEGSGDQLEATCEVKRKDRLPVKRTFSVADAKKAGLWDKPGPWKTYPKRMLQMRARSWACRDSFADALRGIGVIEELRDTTPIVAAREIERPKLVLPEDENQAATPVDEPSFTKCDLFHEEPACDDPNCWVNKAHAEREAVAAEVMEGDRLL